MTRGVYVAGHVADIERVRRVQDYCRDGGWQVTFDWTTLVSQGQEDKTLAAGGWGTKPLEAAQIAANDINRGVKAAALVVAIDSGELRQRGTWIELGAALGAGIPVWLLDVRIDSVFFWHPLVSRFTDEDLLRRALVLRARRIALDEER